MPIRKYANIRASKTLRFLLLIFLLGAAACRQSDPPLVSNVAGNAIKIQITEDGFYKITVDDLQKAGLTIDALESSNLHLSQADTAVPYLINDNALIFYGQAADDPYTAARSYILRTGAAGVTMVETAVANQNTAPLTQVRQTIHLEENNNYIGQTRDTDDRDTWFWQTLELSQKVSLNVNLAAISNTPATLRLHLWGVTQNFKIQNDHDFDLIINDQNLGAIRWDGEFYYTSQTEIPAGILKAGQNSIILDNEVAGASFLDIMELNWLELEYMAPATAVNDRLQFDQTDGTVALNGFTGQPLIFDISDPTAPQRLTEWQFQDGQSQLTVNSENQIAAIGAAGFRLPASIEPLLQSDWQNPENRAELIIITTNELAPAMAPLIEAREAQGVVTALVPVSEIYDEFGFGANSPDSINAFITYAYENWQEPQPRYILLVGDATTDYRNYQGNAPKNNIPSPMVTVEYSGETVSDSRLADVDNDMRPELAVGRWPVDDIDDVKSLVARTLAYEAETAVNRALFVTDGTEAQFADMAQRLWTGSNIPDEEAQLLDGALADEVIAQWNEGAWLTTYIGHGSVERWGKEDIFYPEAVSDLKADNPPIVLQLTCLTGLFAHPELTSLSETMLTHKQGPVLLIAATSLTLSSQQEPFAEAILQSLQDPDIVRIGDAFQKAKLSLDIENNDGLREISDTYVLLGDPSALIVRP